MKVIFWLPITSVAFASGGFSSDFGSEFSSGEGFPEASGAPFAPVNSCACQSEWISKGNEHVGVDDGEVMYGCMEWGEGTLGWCPMVAGAQCHSHRTDEDGNKLRYCDADDTRDVLEDPCECKPSWKFFGETVQGCYQPSFEGTRPFCYPKGRGACASAVMDSLSFEMWRFCDEDGNQEAEWMESVRNTKMDEETSTGGFSSGEGFPEASGAPSTRTMGKKKKKKCRNYDNWQGQTYDDGFTDTCKSQMEFGMCTGGDILEPREEFFPGTILGQPGVVFAWEACCICGGGMRIAEPEPSLKCDGLIGGRCRNREGCIWKNKKRQCLEAAQVCPGLKGKPCRKRKGCEWKNRECVPEANGNDGEETDGPTNGPMNECAELSGFVCRRRSQTCEWKNRKCVPKGDDMNPEPLEGPAWEDNDSDCSGITKGFTCRREGCTWTKGQCRSKEQRRLPSEVELQAPIKA